MMTDMRWLLTMIVCLTLVYLIFKPKKMVWIRSGKTGRYYYVRNEPDSQEAADTLAELELRLHSFLRDAEKHVPPGDTRLQKVRERWQGTLSESLTSDEAAYSLGKRALHICVRDKQTRRMADLNACMFVLCHELAHICTDEYGHTKQFWNNMKYFLELADKTGHYNHALHEREQTTVCGHKLGESPLECVRQGHCSSSLA
jgi:hypothetical protein